MSWSDYISLAALFCSIVGPTAVYLIRSTSKDEAAAAVGDLRKQMIDADNDLNNRSAAAHLSLERTVVDHDRRIIALEERDRAGPQAADIKEITAKLAEIAGDMKALKVEVHSLSNSQERTEKSVGLINETLLSGATK